VCQIFIFSQVNKLKNLFLINYYEIYTTSFILYIWYMYSTLGLRQENNKEIHKIN
jgi:hypothetical protein